MPPEKLSLSVWGIKSKFFSGQRGIYMGVRVEGNESRHTRTNSIGQTGRSYVSVVQGYSAIYGQKMLLKMEVEI